VTPIDTAANFTDYTADRAYGSLALDHLDHLFFPRHGYFLRGQLGREYGDQGSTTAEFTGTVPINVGKLVVQPRLTANYTLERERRVGRLPFQVGGLFNLSGLPVDEVYGLNSLVGSLIFRKGIGGREGKPALYVGGSIESGNAWNGTDRALPEDWLFAGSAYVAINTPVGPIHLAVGKAERRDPTIYFYLGRVLP
jgi:NTE family protein